MHGTPIAEKSITTTLALVLIAIALAACGPRKTTVSVGKTRFVVELAESESARQRGLMYRLMLPRDQGMLFVLPRPQVATFWMKNTYLPLDILYFDANRRLRTIHRNVPPCRRRPCPTYASTGPVLYVLEINAGEAARHAIQPEQPLHIDGGVGITD